MKRAAHKDETKQQYTVITKQQYKSFMNNKRGIHEQQYTVIMSSNKNRKRAAIEDKRV